MNKHDKIKTSEENNTELDNLGDNAEDITENGYSESVIENDFDDDFDDDLEARIASYGEDDTENDTESEVKEFLSRDSDIIAESRKRVNQPGKKVVRTGEKVKKDKTSSGESRTGSIFDAVRPVFGKWMEFYHNNTMKILFSALGGLAVILVITIIILLASGTEKNEDKTSDGTKEETTIQQTETTAQPDTEDVIQPEAADSEIQVLINAYIDAAYMKADMDAVANCVDDITNINVETFKSRQKYIESYQNVKSYKLNSAIENAFIVFVTYDAKIYNIETLAPSAETFIVVYNDTEKRMYIHNPTVAEELDGYIAESSNLSAISELSQDVKNRLAQALAADAELKRVFDIMTGAGQSSAEDTTAAGQ